MRSSRGKRLLARIPLILFGIAIGALIAEVALRITGYSYPEFYQLDYSRGYALRPGIEGRYRKEGGSYVRINSDGLRDREHQKSKPPNTIRIAILGDSYAEALQVSQEQTFWSILEKQLSNCNAFAGKTVEVINFGVSGYGTAQELITLREHVWDYSPDIVLLTVTTNNDITDNSQALKKTEEVPYFVYRDDRLVLDNSFQHSRPFRLRQSFINRLGRWFKDHSRLVQVVNEGHHGFKILLASWRSHWNGSTQNAVFQGTGDQKVVLAEELGIDNLVYFEPTDPVWREAWNVTEGLIKQVSDEVRAHGARFIVVTLSNPAQVLPTEQAKAEYIKRNRVKDLFYPDTRIKTFCDRFGIATIILAPELQSYAEQQHVLLHGFGADIGNGHWNATGHRVAGELIARKLCEAKGD